MTGGYNDGFWVINGVTVIRKTSEIVSCIGWLSSGSIFEDLNYTALKVNRVRIGSMEHNTNF